MEEVPDSPENTHPTGTQLEDNQQRFNSISLDTYSTEPNQEAPDLNICIESFQVIEERLTKHVNYKILGEENSSKFEINRRYKEFCIFHRVLSQNWPGCIIPKIPPKKSVGNLKTSFIDKRKKLLESFLLKIASRRYFCNSELFKSFVHNPLNFKKIEKDFKIPSFLEISTLYHELFAEFTYFQPSLQQRSELRDLLTEFQGIHQVIKKVKRLAKDSSVAFSRYEESISDLMNHLKTITPLVLPNRNINIAPKENYVNTYVYIREWLRADLLDLESVIDGINRILAFEEEIKNLEVKIDKKKRNLESLQSGKKSISQRLSNKPQDAMVSEEEKSIEEIEGTKEAMEKILSICIGKALQSDIPKFKQQKIFKICATMRNYSIGTVQEYQEIAEQILQIEESLIN